MVAGQINHSRALFQRSFFCPIHSYALPLDPLFYCVYARPDSVLIPSTINHQSLPLPSLPLSSSLPLPLSTITIVITINRYHYHCLHHQLPSSITAVNHHYHYHYQPLPPSIVSSIVQSFRQSSPSAVIRRHRVLLLEDTGKIVMITYPHHYCLLHELSSSLLLRHIPPSVI